MPPCRQCHPTDAVPAVSADAHDAAAATAVASRRRAVAPAPALAHLLIVVSACANSFGMQTYWPSSKTAGRLAIPGDGVSVQGGD
jgi:hypothetical protein